MPSDQPSTNHGKAPSRSFHQTALPGYLFGAIATAAGIYILIFGEMGRGIGDTIYHYDGLERMVHSLYCFVIGGASIWAFRFKAKIELKKENR